MIKLFRHLGHAAVFFENDNFVIAVDPWLKGNPACPKEWQTPDKLDLIILTHGHTDHAGDALRLAKTFNCQIIAVFELANLLIRCGLSPNNVIGMGKGGSFHWNEFKISLTDAVHSSSYSMPDGRNEYAGGACGVIIQDGHKTFYHAGDTALFSDMKLIGENFEPDIAFLPIGDHFTMGSQDAAKAALMCRAKAVVPIHYDTFPAISGTLSEFKEKCNACGIRQILTPVIAEAYEIK